MKIIDNKKDYYDYFVGIYGIDNKVVFDRRGSIPSDDILSDNSGFFSTVENDSNISYNIGGECILYLTVEVGFKKWYIKVHRKRIDDNKAELSYELYDPIAEKRPDWAIGRWWDKEHERKVRDLKKRLGNDIINIKFDYGYNYKFSHRYYSKVYNNPILNGFSPIKRIIPPEEIWNACYDYIIANQIPKVEDNRTDVQHLESAGFDKKTSFRNIK